MFESRNQKLCTLTMFTICGLLLAGPAWALDIVPTNDADIMAASIIKGGVSIVSASYDGADGACGTYIDGPLGMPDGMIMTSGAALNALPPNSDEGTSTSNGGGSDALCSQLTAPFGSEDCSAYGSCPGSGREIG